MGRSEYFSVYQVTSVDIYSLHEIDHWLLTVLIFHDLQFLISAWKVTLTSNIYSSKSWELVLGFKICINWEFIT